VTAGVICVFVGEGETLGAIAGVSVGVDFNCGVGSLIVSVGFGVILAEGLETVCARFTSINCFFFKMLIAEVSNESAIGTIWISKSLEIVEELKL